MKEVEESYGLRQKKYMVECHARRASGDVINTTQSEKRVKTMAVCQDGFRLKAPAHPHDM